MNKFCNACGMPLVKKEDFVGGDVDSNFCLYCANADGSVKSCEEIFEGGVRYFMSQLGGDRKIAERIVRKNMTQLKYWHGNESKILNGEMATDEEFAEVLKKLS